MVLRHHDEAEVDTIHCWVLVKKTAAAVAAADRRDKVVRLSIASAVSQLMLIAGTQ